MPKNNYNPDASLFLQNAAMFLREWCKNSRRPRNKKRTDKLYVNTVLWLTANKLQGDLKLPRGI